MCMRTFGEESSVPHLPIDGVDLLTHIQIESRDTARESSGDTSKFPVS